MINYSSHALGTAAIAACLATVAAPASAQSERIYNISAGPLEVALGQFGAHAVLLRLNRPDKRNALATDLLGRIADALDQAAADAAVRVVVVTGSDRLFAAGADINELAERDTPGALSDPRPAIWARIRAFPKPLIAAVEGWSLGAGNELVLCCDLVVAGRGAKLGQPETNLGIIPGAGGAAILPRLVGRSRAMRMVLLGDPISAEEARDAGLVAEVTDDGQRCEHCWIAGSAFPWAVTAKTSGAFLGVLELRLTPPKADLGYIFAEPFWGNGFATEAASVVVAWVIAQPAILRIWATCHPNNAASAAVLRRVGLSYEATLANWEARPQLDEVAGPSHCYALTKSAIA